MPNIHSIVQTLLILITIVQTIHGFASSSIGIGLKQQQINIQDTSPLHDHVATRGSPFGQRVEYNKFNKIIALRVGATGLLATPSAWSSLTSTPTALYNLLLGGLATTTFIWKLVESRSNNKSNTNEATTSSKPAEVKSLQFRFLAVFWLLRMADWLQGPYFYEVYSSKVINNLPVSLDMVSKLFLVGFATTGTIHTHEYILLMKIIY
jgi:hypothetical protein